MRCPRRKPRAFSLGACAQAHFPSPSSGRAGWGSFFASLRLSFVSSLRSRTPPHPSPKRGGSERSMARLLLDFLSSRPGQEARCRKHPHPPRSKCRAPTASSTITISRRPRRRPHLGRVQPVRDVDVRRAFGRRLHLCGEPVLSRADRLAGAGLHDHRHPGGLCADEPHRPAVAALRHSLSGGGAHQLRRRRRQSRRGGARHRRHRLVRRADLFRLEGGSGAGDHAHSVGGLADPWRFRRACRRSAGRASCSCGSSS